MMKATNFFNCTTAPFVLFSLPVFFFWKQKPNFPVLLFCCPPPNNGSECMLWERRLHVERAAEKGPNRADPPHCEPSLKTIQTIFRFLTRSFLFCMVTKAVPLVWSYAAPFRWKTIKQACIWNKIIPWIKLWKLGQLLLTSADMAAKLANWQNPFDAIVTYKWTVCGPFCFCFGYFSRFELCFTLHFRQRKKSDESVSFLDICLWRVNSEIAVSCVVCWKEKQNPVKRLGGNWDNG